jgi:hypothetical protein
MNERIVQKILSASKIENSKKAIINQWLSMNYMRVNTIEFRPLRMNCQVLNSNLPLLSLTELIQDDIVVSAGNVYFTIK